MPRAEFPTPEEMAEMMRDHHEMTMSMVVTHVEVANLLGLAAEALNRPCPVPAWECENCNRANTLWWNLCNALPNRERIALQSALRDAGVPLPKAPWETVAER